MERILGYIQMKFQEPASKICKVWNKIARRYGNYTLCKRENCNFNFAMPYFNNY